MEIVGCEKVYIQMKNVRNMSMWDAYLVPHLGTGVNVKAQIVVGQFGGLFLQLPGERDLPITGNKWKQTFLDRYCKRKAHASCIQKKHTCMQLGDFFLYFKKKLSPALISPFQSVAVGDAALQCAFLNFKWCIIILQLTNFGEFHSLLYVLLFYNKIWKILVYAPSTGTAK